jgi:hypothetical protein
MLYSVAVMLVLSVRWYDPVFFVGRPHVAQQNKRQIKTSKLRCVAKEKQQHRYRNERVKSKLSGKINNN